MSANEDAIDDDVICRAANGDRDAQRLIYEAFGGRVFRTVQRIVGASDAADVTQNTLIHLFEKLPSFRHESAFETWLHRLTVNEALQHLRKRSRHLMKTQPLSPNLITPDQRDSSQGDVMELITTAMERIEPELKLIFQLKEVDELSYAQIGEIIGIPEGTVASRLNRARKELRDQLLKLGWEP